MSKKCQYPNAQHILEMDTLAKVKCPGFVGEVCFAFLNHFGRMGSCKRIGICVAVDPKVYPTLLLAL